MRIRTIAASAAALAVILGGGTAALAATGSPAASSSAQTSTPKDEACVNSAHRTLSDFHASAAKITCPKGSFFTSWNQAGPQGAAGKTGPSGPSGIVATTTADLGGVASVPTGGSFVSRSTDVGTISLKAGTYLISVNAKATPDASSDIEVFPQFFVYNQAVNPAFAGDLLNVGSGPLASNSTTIDSYFSGSGTITLTAPTTLHVIAFGYDSDTSAGTYKLDDVTVTATQINAG